MNRKLTGFRLQVIVVFLFLLFTVPCTLLPAYAHSEIHTVIIKEDGFEPSELTLDNNSTVIFVNQDKVERWPASNIHPSHDIYPEFDPKKPIPPGSSWAFKPKIGNWKYHDHLLPHQRGIII